ncbi:hypothetical protein A9G35_06825 [Gilliamella sp. Choc5-1]|jgi:hypothetical protein|nr:hypothetical protein A9G35_06825 [Gilliamella apicola]
MTNLAFVEFCFYVLISARKWKNQVGSGISNIVSKLMSEMKTKIIEGQSITNTNKIVGEHS